MPTRTLWEWRRKNELVVSNGAFREVEPFKKQTKRVGQNIKSLEAGRGFSQEVVFPS